MPVMTVVAIAVVLYVAYRMWRDWAERRGATAPLKGDPDVHADAEVVRSMQAWWVKAIEEQASFLREDLLDTEESRRSLSELQDYIRSQVEAVDFTWDGETATCLVTIHCPGYHPMGPWSAEVWFAEGYWQFKRIDGDADEEDAGQRVVIGEPVVLQTSWKEPPFAITVLGRPERIEGDRERVRVPVRFTGIVHRWSHFSVSGYPALMYTSENDDGERIVWESEYENRWGLEFEDFVLVQGGTWEGYLYFRAGEDEERKTVPRRRFVELTWLDDSETVISVDLRTEVEPAERIRFRDGVPEQALDKRGVAARLRGLGSQWADIGDAPLAGIGDAVKVAVVPGGKERWDVTALGEPKPVAEDLVRLPVRVTSRFRESRPFDDDLLSIGTTPEEFGVIQHLWEPRDFEQEGGRPADCLHGVELKRNETREGAVYFSPTGRGAKEPPTEAFTTLWYGVNFMEMPVRLSPNG